MAYVRTHGNQLELVHGARDPETKQVRQCVLFTFHSKHEALDAIGEGKPGVDHAFQHFCEDTYPDIRFDWPTITRKLRDLLPLLPDRPEDGRQRLDEAFQASLFAFTRQLALTNPHLDPDGQAVLRHHHPMLRILADLIHQRIGPDLAMAPDMPPMPWTMRLNRRHVPPDIEELAVSHWERRDLDRAEAAFSLLVNAFEDYAEGHNYLGLIALERDQLEDAIAHFRKTMEVGRKRFPKRLAKRHYWSHLETRPYMRGLRNLALTLNRVGSFDEALALCDRLDDECGDTVTADCFRAMIRFNLGQPLEAYLKARSLKELFPDMSFIAALALFAMDRRDDAARHFAHATLNHPRAAQMLFGKNHLPRPQDNDEIADHNAGVTMRRNLTHGLSRLSRATRAHFRDMLDSEAIASNVETLRRATCNWHTSRGGDRRDFDTMHRMTSFEFASALMTPVQDVPRAHQLKYSSDPD